MNNRIVSAWILFALLPLVAAHSQPAPPAPLQVDDDGAVHLPALLGSSPDNGVPPLIAGYPGAPAREAFDVTVEFFNRHLGRRKKC